MKIEWRRQTNKNYTNAVWGTQKTLKDIIIILINDYG